MEILNHLLVDCEVVHLKCAKNTRRIIGPDMIIVHYTSGSSAMSSAIYLTRPDVAASTHLVIGRDGELIQLVPFSIEAWHAGRSCYAGREELNHYSIGIELDNMGQLRLEKGKFIAECGKEVSFREVYVKNSGKIPTYWHKYTDAQMDVLMDVIILLKKYYPIKHIVGHSDVTRRKVDPGPAFPLTLPLMMK